MRFDFTHTGNRELPLIIGQLQILPRHWWQERDLSRRESAPALETIATLVLAEDGRSVTITLNEGENLPSAEDVQLSRATQDLPALAAVKSLHIADARRLRAELNGPASEDLLAALRA